MTTVFTWISHNPFLDSRIPGGLRPTQNVQRGKVDLGAFLILRRNDSTGPQIRIPTQETRALKDTTWFLRKSRFGATTLMSVRRNILPNVNLGAEVQTVTMHIMDGAIVDTPRRTVTTMGVDIKSGTGGDSFRLTVY